MFKKIINFIIIIFILFLIIIGFINYKILLMSINDTCKIFMFNVFPFLFFMILLNNILLNINTRYFVKNNFVYLFVMSIISGAPINAIIINEYLNKQIINENDASLLLCATSFNNPIFLYNYFIKIFNNQLICFKLLLFIYIINLVLYIFIIKKIKINMNNNYEKYDIRKVINSSFKQTINNLLVVFTTITFFKLICDLLFLNNNIYTSLFRGLIEITQGLNSILNLNISSKIKELLVLIILNFGSLSIHMQISFILEKHNINYKYFYLSKIILILASFIILIL